MSFFKKALSSIGIGNADVDAQILNEYLQPGSDLEANLVIKGGKVEQQVDQVELALYCQYRREEENEEGETEIITETFRLAEWTLSESFTLAPGEDKQFDVSLELPWQTPMTFGECRVWLSTSLDIAMAVDPSDRDELTISPEPLLQSCINSLQSMGFVLREAECEEAGGFPLPFVQELEFVPQSGDFRGRIDELEIITVSDDNGMNVWLEVDRKARGFSGLFATMLGRDEVDRHLYIDRDSSDDEIYEQLEALLDQNS